MLAWRCDGCQYCRQLIWTGPNDGSVPLVCHQHKLVVASSELSEGDWDCRHCVALRTRTSDRERRNKLENETLLCRQRSLYESANVATASGGLGSRDRQPHKAASSTCVCQRTCGSAMSVVEVPHEEFCMFQGKTLLHVYVIRHCRSPCCRDRVLPERRLKILKYQEKQWQDHMQIFACICGAAWRFKIGVQASSRICDMSAQQEPFSCMLGGHHCQADRDLRSLAQSAVNWQGILRIITLSRQWYQIGIHQENVLSMFSRLLEMLLYELRDRRTVPRPIRRSMQDPADVIIPSCSCSCVKLGQ